MIKHTNVSKDLVILQLVLVIVMFLATLGSVLLPLLIIKCYRNIQDESSKTRFSYILSSLTMFVSGTFLGLAMLDMLPDVLESMGEVLVHTTIFYPLGEFVVSFGLLLMIILDQILIGFREQNLSNTGATSTEDVPEQQGTKPVVFHAIVLFLSLACHSFFEGLVIIASRNTVSGTLTLFFPIFLHKIVVAFGLGLNSVQTDMSKFMFLLLSFFFSAMSPVGMLLGLFLEYILNLHTLSWLSTILGGIACGTFLYVVFFELLPRELSKSEFRITKLAMLTAGFASMSLFAYINNEIE